MKLLCRSTASLILIFVLFSHSIPVHADVAPPPFPEASDIYPDGEVTHVRMVSEKVDLTILDETSKDYPYGYALVKAIFHMQNLGTAPETIDVYFPLDIGNCEKDAEKMRLHVFQIHPPIREFRAVVNGTEKPINTIYQRLHAETSTDPLETDVACWVYFPTSFPAGKNVTIEVSYKVSASAQFQGPFPYLGYGYILRTGSGWKDTIGSADVTVHLPYSITSENVYGYRPDEGTIQGNKIVWHFENFEPDNTWDIDIGMLKPTLWKAIQAELMNTRDNPQDGEAWGRLGKAYKEAVILDKGVRNDAAGAKMYQASVEAYQRALDLKPEDADWHAGYAELLCTKAYWTFDIPNRERFFPCIEELKKALDLNPEQTKAKGLLADIWVWNKSEEDPLVDLSGPQPNYLILTPLPAAETLMPAATPAATILPTVSPKTQTATAAPIATYPLPAADAAVTSQPTKTPGEATTPGLCGSVALPILIGLLFFIWNKQIKL